MKKLFALTLFALLLNISVFSQEKIYFDENWEKTTQDKMEYYRQTEPKGKLTLIKDYYKDGTLQMEGLASDATPQGEVYEGKVTWYTREGKTLSSSTYSKGKQLGPSQSFDEKGRLLEDVSYTKDGNFTGKIYTYKEVENSLYFNSVTIYESSQVYKTIIYDDDLKGIRYETSVDKDGNSETKYYGDKGKSIGSSSYSSSSANNGTLVEYYYNPMTVSKIEKYKNGNIVETTVFGKNGKTLQEEKKNKKDGYKTTYDESGKKIGNLIYKLNTEGEYIIPYEGEDYQFTYDFLQISAVDVYKNGSLVSNKSFSENGKLFSEKTLKDNSVQEIKYYNDNGSLKSSITYKEDMPYNGTLYEGSNEQVYKDGILIHSKVFSEGTTLQSEKKLNANKNAYESTVYNTKGAIVYSYTQPLEQDYSFSAQIVQYINGKPTNKSVVKSGILQSGKIKMKTDSGTKEIERSGKWILLKMYDATGKLTQDSKILANSEQDDINYNDQIIISEDNLLYNTL
ncbi:membrane-binding protein [Chryseobacterium sp. T16E-39]|uniref:membrane-binding protein n=1 Tax=Chryseobacterium sp. T16E-39 TaxID=2015076 RepID=UPI000B5B40F4|nr:membrane-binding protein [Chryseobacterium sp. T16E-39]ASK32499.1 membrane-binding protein [Chryseobacterium sp. T16E-39]